MIARHWHWEFLAYNGEPNAEKVQWGVKVEVIGFLTEADAKIAAADIVQREQHNLIRVWECAECGYRQSTARSMNRLAIGGR